MGKFASGWEIVCPDGVLRHLPYHNYEDAAFDAGLLGELVCVHWDEAEREVACPGGEHTVRPIVFDDEPPGAVGAPS